MSDNIFTGLKVVDMASVIAGPSAATILGDFGANIIKVEPPSGDLWRIAHKVPPLPTFKDPYGWHLVNRNKRGMTLNLKLASATEVLERLVKWADVLIANTPHKARKKLRAEYEDVVQWNPRLIYADLTGYGDKGPDADLPGFDATAYWSRTGLLAVTHDADSPPTFPFFGTGDSATAVGLFSAIVMGLYRRERTGKGCYVTTSLLAEGVWAASVAIQAALCGARFSPQHDRTNPANPLMNLYKSSDGIWFLLVVTPDKIALVASAIGRSDLLKDPRFAPAKLAANMKELTAIIDESFSSKPMAHWQEVLDKARIPYGLVRDPGDVIKDPQLAANSIVVPLEGAGDRLAWTVSSPMQVRDIPKTPAKRAPELGEHNDEILKDLGFAPTEIDRLHASGVVPDGKAHAPPGTG